DWGTPRGPGSACPVSPSAHRMARVLTTVLLVFLAAGAASHLNAQTASDLRETYKARFSNRAETLLCEVVRFRTEAGNAAAHQQQKKWLQTQADAFGLVFRDAG